MRPYLQILDDDLVQRIIDEAVDVLCTLGVEILNEKILEFLAEHSLSISKKNNRVIYNKAIIEKAIKSTPPFFSLYDSEEKESTYFSGKNIHFTPGSSALNIYDTKLNQLRKPTSKDYITYVKIIDQLEHLATQSTAFVPSDVDTRIADVYRLYLSLIFGKKPVITGTFSSKSFNIMYDLQCLVRGSEKKLWQKPLTIFTCCPTSPMKWNVDSVETLYDCARKNIPVEIVPMPLAGFSSPVTMTGTLIQHCAEVLSGLVIHQLANPGTPVLYGTAATTFEMRNGTTPLGAIESIMMACGANEVGKKLGLPTQAYISLSDAKNLDLQAGFETGMGAILASLSGINNISGPGMMEFANCFSLDKLIVDNEIAGIALHFSKGISPKEDFPAINLLNELISEQNLITSIHTRKYLEDEHFLPGPVVNRQNMNRWIQNGSPKILERSQREINRLVEKFGDSHKEPDLLQELQRRMKDYGNQLGIELPKMSIH